MSPRIASTPITASPARPGRDQALAAVREGDTLAVREGDTLVVPKLDRLARSAPDAHAIADQLQERGVNLAIGRALYAPADPMGKMFFNILATFAEFEADLISMPPASVPSAISPSSSPSQDQPSIAHSTGAFPLSVRSCPSPESTSVTATPAWARLESRECWRSDCLARECRQFKNIGLQASVSVIPAKAGTRNPVAGKYAFAANGLWIPAFAGMTVNMTTLPRG